MHESGHGADGGLLPPAAKLPAAVQEPTGRAAIFSGLRNAGTAAAPDIRPVLEIPDGTVFRFNAHLRDPSFYNITAIDQERIISGNACVFSSAGIAAADIGGRRVVTVHAGVLPDPVPVVGKRFARTIARGDDPSRRRLLRDGTQVHEQAIVLEPDGTATEPIEVLVDATGLGDGLHTLRILDIDGAPITSAPVFLSDDGRVGSRVGLIEAHYSHAIMGNRQEPELRLSFPARAVEWIYDIAVRTVLNPEPDASLAPGRLRLAGTPAAFDGPDVAAGDPARVTFTSTAPIALRRRPHSGIELQYAPEPPGGAPAPPPPPAPPEPQILIKNLPNPDVSRLVLEGGTLKSRMRLTLN